MEQLWLNPPPSRKPKRSKAIRDLPNTVRSSVLRLTVARYCQLDPLAQRA
jgi:hypothetical protein